MNTEKDHKNVISVVKKAVINLFKFIGPLDLCLALYKHANPSPNIHTPENCTETKAYSSTLCTEQEQIMLIDLRRLFLEGFKGAYKTFFGVGSLDFRGSNPKESLDTLPRPVRHRGA